MTPSDGLIVNQKLSTKEYVISPALLGSRSIAVTLNTSVPTIASSKTDTL